MEKEKKQAVVVLLVSLCLAGAVWAADNKSSRIGASGQLTREAYGKGKKTESLLVEIAGSKKKQPVTVQIEEKQYSTGEKRKVLERAVEELDRLFPGQNKSCNHVDRDLYLLTAFSDLPVTVSWQLSRYDVMGIDGKLLQDRIEAEGTLVTVTGLLRCGEEEALFERTVHLYPKAEKGEAAAAQKAARLLREEEENKRDQETVSLPEKVDGKKLVWYRASVNRGPFFLLLGSVAAVCPFLWKRQREAEQWKKRKQQLLSDYPEIISQFALLTGAGMTAKSAWRTILNGYKGKQKKKGEKRYAYEEMVVTWNEMKSGVAEQECYERFGARCGLQIYMRFGAMLSQNLKKGAAGMQDTLRAEAANAFEERKRMARVRGEEAGTKLLAPMFLMLAVVLVIVIVPAFLSMHV